MKISDKEFKPLSVVNSESLVYSANNFIQTIMLTSLYVH